MVIEDDPRVIYVCFWCGDQFEVADDVMVNFRIGQGPDGTRKYVPSCPKCSKIPEEKEDTGYVH